jgi:hypothetical protein
MNYQKKYRRNLKMLSLYAEYLPLCTTLEQRINLSCEISKLKSEIKIIEEMSYSDSLQEIDFYVADFESLINHI